MLQSLIAEIKEYKKPSVLASLYMVFEVMFEISIPFIMATLLDKGVQKGDMTTVLTYGLLMLVFAFLSLFCGMQSARYGAFASAGFAKNLRKAIFKKIQTFSFENIDSFSSGGLVTRMMTDVTNVQNSYQMVIRICVRAPLNLIFAIVASYLINPQMAMIFVGITLFLGLVLGVITKIVYPLFTKVFEAYDNLNNSIQENITNMRVVKSYVKEEEETVKFKKASRLIYNMFMKAIRIVILSSPAMMLSLYASFILISWIGAQLIVAGSFTTGELTSMFAYVMTILMSLMMFMMIFVMLSISMASVERINEVLGTESTIVSPENGLTEVADGSITFDHVNFAYTDENGDKAHVLSDINLSIRSGEVIGILGGTGSGKSSLVQLIPRLYDVESGSVKVAGQDVRNYDLDHLRKQVAMVLQTNVLFSGTIKENMRWGNKDATDEEIVEACKIAQADEFIQNFKDGYDTMIERGGANVSGGQRQRLCIARALLMNPKILILDDSTSAVDTKTDSLIRQGLASSLKDTTKIIIGQRISSIQDADRIVVMNDGKIDAIGTHQELIETNAIYREVYDMQTQGKGGQADEE
ncbi:MULTISPECIES: ABC transporter ATP-binding protein [Streptococcus]|uniref:ABC transporter ATP-binding protein n=1 Tax=Streptococcus xiaochunlingii TaxID=2589788 RepID=A0ABY2YG67_9STRE|nr:MULTISPECIES: ABC transporter ATP-binding protein [Streptococcus]AMP66881.1 ABC transporter [Streptococcus sp. A12]RSK11995.1 putative ABC transporter ATP-binding protein [Streptococcus australis]TPE38123.1 ABC transporter ATP-binding protein [Streptococcus xiaochunlingii]